MKSIVPSINQDGSCHQVTRLRFGPSWRHRSPQTKSLPCLLPDASLKIAAGQVWKFLRADLPSILAGHVAVCFQSSFDEVRRPMDVVGIWFCGRFEGRVFEDI